MLKKIITYTDYNGVERTEEHHFNLSKTDLARMQNSRKGGLDAVIKKIIDEKDNEKMYELFEDIVLKSYGIKDEDGIRFKKSKEITEAFSQTGAFDELMFELLSDPDAATAFINGIIPQTK